MTATATIVTLGRLDFYTVWGRAVAHAVGYATAEARALGLAWAYRRTDPHRREPRSGGFPFAGYRLHRSERSDGVVGFTAHGAVRWSDDYAAVRDRIGADQHDALLADASELLYVQPIEQLDRTMLAAELLHRQLGRIGIGEPFRTIRYDRARAAMRP